MGNYVVKDYVEVWVNHEMTLCEAYKRLHEELLQSEMTEQRTLDLLGQRKQLQAHMADRFMRKMGYVSHDGTPKNENCYPAKVWEVAE